MNKDVLRIYKYFFIGYGLRSRQVKMEDGSFRIFIRPSIMSTFKNENLDALMYSCAVGIYL